MTSTSQIVTVKTTCFNFPYLPPILIKQEHLFDVFEEKRRNGYSIVLEGDEGTGKTTLVAQLAERHLYTTIALFIQLAAKISYQQWSIRHNLCRQIAAIVNHTSVESELRSEGLLEYLYSKLMYQAHSENKKYLFIIDGYEGIPQKDAAFIEQIFELLPLGSPQFQFIFSGGSEKIPTRVKEALRFYTASIYPFSHDEVKFLFADLNLTNEDITRIETITRKTASGLAVVRRLMNNGSMTIEQLINQMPQELQDLLALEWNPVSKTMDSAIRTIFAILAFDDQSTHTLADLARLANISEQEVKEKLSAISFVYIDLTSHDVTLASEAHRKYIALHIDFPKSKVDGIIIADFQSRKDDEKSLARLPFMLNEQGRTDEVFQFLTLESLLKLIEKQQSLGLATYQAQLGVSLSLDGPLYKLFEFSLLHSLLLDLCRTGIGKNEIEARLSLGDFDSAMALAQQATLKEDRLRLLASVCSWTD